MKFFRKEKNKMMISIIDLVFSVIATVAWLSVFIISLEEENILKSIVSFSMTIFFIFLSIYNLTQLIG